MALAGCATGPLPDFVFSLTAWASGPEVEFLLLNVTTRPVRAVSAVLDNLSFEVRDDTGASLTGGFVPFRARPGPPPSPGRARRLAPQKVFRETIPTNALLAAVEARIGAPLDRTRRYAVAFETLAPVLGPDGMLLMARVKSRSLCAISFQGGRARTDCGSA